MEELTYEPNEYGFDLHDTGFEGIEYRRIESRDGSSTYEGFAAKDLRVNAFETIMIGGVYFGEWVNYERWLRRLLGRGWRSLSMFFRDGELIDVEMQASDAPDLEEESSFMRDYVRTVVGGDDLEFTGSPLAAFVAE